MSNSASWPPTHCYQPASLVEGKEFMILMNYQTFSIHNKKYEQILNEIICGGQLKADILQWKERKNNEEMDDRTVLKKAGEEGEVEVRDDEAWREPHRKIKCPSCCLPLSSLQTQCT